MKSALLYALQLLILTGLSGCATKYIVASNRFITPESQGDAFRGQVELQQTSANQMTVNTTNGTVDEGVVYQDVNRSGFLLSSSIFSKLDVVWSHAGGGNSMMGAKFQIVGDPRITKSSGHKASLGALIGGNEHETDDKTVEFELTGREYLFTYGYRFTENVMPYTSVSLGTFNFLGKIKAPNTALDGLEPNLITSSRAFSAGVEFSYETWFVKLEGTYQQLKTEDTKDRERYAIGYALGYSF